MRKELLARQRMRGANIDRSTGVAVRNEEFDGANEIGIVNPGDILATGTGAAQQGEADEPQYAGENTTRIGTHDGRDKQIDANSEMNARRLKATRYRSGKNRGVYFMAGEIDERVSAFESAGPFTQFRWFPMHSLPRTRCRKTADDSDRMILRMEIAREKSAEMARAARDHDAQWR